MSQIYADESEKEVKKVLLSRISALIFTCFYL